MLFFGFFCFASWIGSFLSLSENLPPSFMPKVSPTKVSSNLDKLLSNKREFLETPKQRLNVWSTTILPTRFLKIDWGSKESTPTKAKLSNVSFNGVKESKNKFCSSVSDIASEQIPVKTASVLPIPRLIESSLNNRDLLPNKILRSLQNFFNFSTMEQGFATTPVVVVRRDQDNYEVWVNNRKIASLPDEIEAKSMQQRLTQVVNLPRLDANQFRPALVDGIPALMAGNRFLFGIEKEVSRQIHRSGELLAIEWINNLRSALQAPAFSLVEGQQKMYGLIPSKKKMFGLASWYGGYFHGRTTANGEKYNQDELTVAHKSLPFNTFLQVTNLKNGNSVIVRVNDRGPYIPPRSLDLSREAARCINSETAGVVPYKAVILQSNEPKMTLKNSSVSTANLKTSRKLTRVSDY
ncbi:septal ring lytic transglycosylase RlpA family protein [Scytonema hofmannii FACHB-248]|uniref:Probable endolytic peptidoglycan transglycosylase RlpA n=1 Tax=Scytonema hofmannii FACHB-248 TaxID=1842502 RepID=A0ABR8GU88_9CYAN|nr:MULTISPECIES: septal ring lytic transglycosylase RlpA family protein [Nostocales]MBD2606298.1 septal ring lytic transglycosylase RlpA family protein [Scytonema hofmannii FACHB-248]